jgi:hypothetical protein
MVGSNWPHVPWPETELGYDPNELMLPVNQITYDVYIVRNYSRRKQLYSFFFIESEN